jgi:hypothetical protein
MSDLLTPIWHPSSPASTPTTLRAREWQDLLGQARRSRLLPRLALHFADRGALDAVPMPARDYLEGALHIVERQRHEVLAELGHIRRALQPTDTPVVLLKGAAYLFAGLAASRGRVFSDIDLLVPHERLDRTENALFAAGWISSERSRYNQRYYRQWMHEIPPVEHVQRGSVIDLHHTIAPPTSRFKLDAAKLFERARAIGDSGFSVLGPQDMVLHSALHLYQEGEFDHGLRDLLDLHALLTQFEASELDFWPGLLARAQDLGLGEPLFHVLAQLQELVDLRIPAPCQAALKALRPPWLSRWLIGGLLTQVLRPQHPSCDTLSGRIARWLLYVRSHSIRMPLTLLLPHLLRKAYIRRFPQREI